MEKPSRGSWGANKKPLGYVQLHEILPQTLKTAPVLAVTHYKLNLFVRRTQSFIGKVCSKTFVTNSVMSVSEQ